MNFPVGVILSLTTGRLLCPFDELHKFIEHVAGHPVWTHEMAERGLSTRLSHQVFNQHPALLNVAEFTPPADKDNVGAYCKTYVAKEIARLGVVELDVARGSVARTESPLDSLHRLVPDREVVVVEVPSSNSR
jgi:hypothetical protein